ncbi:MAG: hypothetical protein EDR02_06455 [Actinobacteria bacterium]|nr:MAG: hypothetical protein EDR02_06455 [Actinomycetota bacterium]RIK04792.1 MAG: hypothetical protein DCC48_12150 [Acidobacteriota bacterium]
MGLLLLSGQDPARAATGQTGGSGTCAEHGCVNVIEIDGLVDEVVADFIEASIDESESEREVIGLVLQLDSPGVALDSGRLERLAENIQDAAVPVSVWIGPSGAEALDGAAELVALAKTSSISPGSDIGELGQQRLDPERFGELFGEEAAEIRDKTVDWEEAVDLGLVDRAAPTLGDHLLELAGFETEVAETGGEPRREPLTVVRFLPLPLLSQLMHTVASPAVAYLLFGIGLGLLVFEFFTAGVGIAGVAGAVSLVLAAYGLAALPTNSVGVGLMVFAMFGFAVDIQTGVPRIWTGVGLISFVAGSLVLFDGVSVSWLTLVVGIVGMGLAMLSGMPAMVRSRFSTPTIGRDWMIDELGDAVTDLDPDGTVRVHDALWRARTNRATPVARGARVRVTGIEGVVLEIEPAEGGARRHRKPPEGS